METTRYAPDQIPEQAEGLFTAAEFRVLDNYFAGDPGYDGLDVDLTEIVVQDTWPSVNAAVALILLERIQDRLPRWMGRNFEGELVVSRAGRKARRDRRILMKPVYAGSREGFGAGPGMSWRIEYHTVWVPLFDRFVVTESRDDGEDFAIGHFASAVPFDPTKASRIIAGESPDRYDSEGKEITHGYEVWVDFLEDDMERSSSDSVHESAVAAIARCRAIIDEWVDDFAADDVETDPESTWQRWCNQGSRPRIACFGEVEAAEFDPVNYMRALMESVHGKFASPDPYF